MQVMSRQEAAVKRGDRIGNARVLITFFLVALVAAAVFAAPVWAVETDADSAGAHGETAVAASGEAHGGGHGDEAPHIPPYWMVVFFVLMLLTIAVLPLTPLNHWWENNTRRFMVALSSWRTRAFGTTTTFQPSRLARALKSVSSK